CGATQAMRARQSADQSVAGAWSGGEGPALAALPRHPARPAVHEHGRPPAYDTVSQGTDPLRVSHHTVIPHICAHPTAFAPSLRAMTPNQRTNICAHNDNKAAVSFYNAFFGAKYHGFSLLNEWWFRDLNNFRTTPNGMGNIVYQDTLGPGRTAMNALFPA